MSYTNKTIAETETIVELSSVTRVNIVTSASSSKKGGTETENIHDVDATEQQPEVQNVQLDEPLPSPEVKKQHAIEPKLGEPPLVLPPPPVEPHLVGPPAKPSRKRGSRPKKTKRVRTIKVVVPTGKKESSTGLLLTESWVNGRFHFDEKINSNILDLDLRANFIWHLHVLDDILFWNYAKSV